MPGLNAGDIVQVSLVGTLFGQRTLNVLHYQVLEASTAGDYVTAAASFGGAFKAGTVSPYLAILACQSPQQNADEVWVQRVYPTRDIKVITSVGLVGTNANDATFSNVAATITKRGALASRKYIGSIHIPGVSEGNAANGSWNNGFITLLALAAGRMLNVFTVPLETTEARPIIFNKATPGTSLGILQTQAQTTCRVMRRRTVGVGK